MAMSFCITFFVIVAIALILFLLTMKKNLFQNKVLAIIFALVHWICSTIKNMFNFYVNILVRTNGQPETISYQVAEITQVRAIFQWISTVSYILMWIFIILIICQYKKNKSLS